MIARIAGLLIGLWGALLIVGGAAGNTRLTQPLKFAATSIGAPSTPVDAGASRSSGNDFMGGFEAVENLAALHRQVDRAAAQGRWTLVDFYADWCVSCKVIETEVFGDAAVQNELSNVQLLRPDVTANDAADRALMREYGVVGPPTILLIGPDGEERRAARIVGELDAEEFLQHWARAHRHKGAS